MTRKGVWGLQQVRDKQLQSLWEQAFYLQAMGQGNYGEILNNENGDGASRSSPTQLGGTLATGWRSIDTGKESFLGTRDDGTLWVAGYNQSYGPLGQNNGTNYSSPTQVGTDTDWKYIQGGLQTMGGIKTDGTLWMWGTGSALMWVNNAPTMRSSPVQMPGTTWKQLAIGKYTAGAIKTDGTLWMWGDNGQGTLGLNGSGGSPTVNYGSGASSPIQIGTNTNWDYLALNYGGDFRRVMATKTDGTLWTWGSGGVGEMGLNIGGTMRRSSPTQIPGTWATATPGVFDNSEANTISVEDVTACKKADGNFYIWGRGISYGGLGLNDKVSRSSPVLLPGTWVEIKGGYGSGHAIKE